MRLQATNLKDIQYNKINVYRIEQVLAQLSLSECLGRRNEEIQVFHHLRMEIFKVQLCMKAFFSTSGYPEIWREKMRSHNAEKV